MSDKLESSYDVQTGDWRTALYVYPETQIHVDDHPEIQQHLTVRPWGDCFMLTIKHPLGETSLKVRRVDLINGLADLQEVLDN